MTKRQGDAKSEETNAQRRRWRSPADATRRGEKEGGWRKAGEEQRARSWSLCVKREREWGARQSCDDSTRWIVDERHE